jgi:hypothetical protein
MSDPVLESNAVKLAAIKKRRTERINSFDAAARETRLVSELKLGEIEEQTKKTLGIDLAVIFLPSGKMIVVHKPAAVVFNRLMLAQASNAVTEEVICGFCNSIREYPDSDIEIEKMFLEYPNARDAMVNGGIQLAGVDQSNMLGK